MDVNSSVVLVILMLCLCNFYLGCVICWCSLKLYIHCTDHLLQADVYADASGGCVAFLANIDDKNDKTVDFQNVSYKLPAWSVSILPDCKNVVYNTAKVMSSYYEIQAF